VIAQPQTISGLPGSERFGAAVRWLPSGNLFVVDPVFDREDDTVTWTRSGSIAPTFAHGFV
jgi:hypothetical protein